MRALALLAVGLAALGGLLIPSPADSPLGRVAGIDADGPDPRWDAAVDGPALRRAGSVLRDDARYFVWAPQASPLLQGNLKAAAQLFLAPALPVQGPPAGGWILSYRASPARPPAVTEAERIRVGPGTLLVRLAR